MLLHQIQNLFVVDEFFLSPSFPPINIQLDEKCLFYWIESSDRLEEEEKNDKPI
jgi:hypothetical protein